MLSTTHSRLQGYKLATLPSAKLKMKCMLLLRSKVVLAVVALKE